jgi:hypothetical protein
MDLHDTRHWPSINYFEPQTKQRVQQLGRTDDGVPKEE